MFTLESLIEKYLDRLKIAVYTLGDQAMREVTYGFNHKSTEANLDTALCILSIFENVSYIDTTELDDEDLTPIAKFLELNV